MSEHTAYIEIDGESFATWPAVADLLRAVSEERDRLVAEVDPYREATSRLERERDALSSRLAQAEAGVERLREGLQKAADTFHDLEWTLNMLGRSTSAAACKVAEDGCRAYLAASSADK